MPPHLITVRHSQTRPRGMPREVRAGQVFRENTVTAHCMLNDAPAAHRGATLDELQDACVWIEQHTGKILDCNVALPRLVGRRREQLIGLPVTALAHPAEAIGKGSAWHAMLAGHPMTDADIRVVLGGDTLALSASVSPLNEPDGELRCTLGVWRDISQRRRTEVCLQESADRLRAMAYEVTMAEARERERVAQGLHDDIGQSLALVSLKLDELSLSLAGHSSAALVDELRALVVQASRATRTATFELSCPVLQQLGLQAAIESLGQRMERLYGLRVRVQVELPPDCVPHAVRLVVFRVVRELLSNVQKHARASSAWVRSHRHDDRLMFLVWDDGAGFDAREQSRRFSPEGGFGLFSAQAQMQAIGGRLDVDAEPGQGTWATVTVPLAQA